jgi:hypothetical protein
MVLSHAEPEWKVEVVSGVRQRLVAVELIGANAPRAAQVTLLVKRSSGWLGPENVCEGDCG